MNSSIMAFLNTQATQSKENYQKEAISKNNKPSKDFRKTMDEVQEKKENYPDEPTIEKPNVQQVEVKRSTSVIETPTVIKDETSTNEQATEIMMQLLMSQLNLSSEQIDKILKQQGITLEDLTNEETFRQFVMVALETDEISLLSNSDDMKIIKSLWEDLKTVNVTHYNDRQITTQEQVLHNEEVIEVVTKAIEQLGVENNEVSKQVAPEMLAENLSLRQSMQSEKGKVEGRLEIGQSLALNPSQVDVGLTIPIHALSDERGVQFWQNMQGLSSHSLTQDPINPLHTQILEKFHYTELQEGKEVSMNLSPKELGKLSLKMIEQGGVMTAQIRVEQDKTKELIMQNIELLKEGLEKQGLTITDVQVEVKKDPHQSQMEREKQKSTKRIQELILKHMGDSSIDDVIEKTQIDNLTSVEVDYKA